LRNIALGVYEFVRLCPADTLDTVKVDVILIPAASLGRRKRELSRNCVEIKTIQIKTNGYNYYFFNTCFIRTRKIASRRVPCRNIYTVTYSNRVFRSQNTAIRVWTTIRFLPIKRVRNRCERSATRRKNRFPGAKNVFRFNATKQILKTVFFA